MWRQKSEGAYLIPSLSKGRDFFVVVVVLDRAVEGSWGQKPCGLDAAALLFSPT